MTREDFKEYILRNLGSPVVDINIDEQQIEDRIDEALEYFRLYHYDGIEEMYLKHRLTSSVFTLQQPIAEQFDIGQEIIGLESGATAYPARPSNAKSEGNTLYVYKIKGEFIPGEQIVIKEQPNLVVANIVSIELGDTDNRFITLPDHVYGVIKVLPISATSTSQSLFDVQYQLRLHDLFDLTSVSIIYYKQTMQHLSLLDFELNRKPSIQFNRMTNKLYPNINWTSDTRPGDLLVIKCYRAVDPEEFSKVWNDPWLKQYATALVKRNWATNIKKYSGIQLPGGVTLNGQALYDEAMNEIRELQDELINKQAPLNFFIG
jgi:hypothetical protein